MTNKKAILIIDDDVDLIEALKIALESKGYEVSAAFSTGEGFKKAKEIKPDLIVLDVMFGTKGKSEGIDCSVKMKKDKVLAPIPILMLTAINVKKPGFEFSEQSTGEYLPVDDFIDKPAQPEELIEKVEKLLKIGASKWINWPEETKETPATS